MHQAQPSVWVVDDDLSVRRSLGRLLRVAGLRVETFPSPEEFLARSDRQGCGCLLLDVQMPGVNGLSLQLLLRAMGSRVPIVFISADEDGEARQQALARGAVAFLGKPLDEEELLGAIRLALNDGVAGLPF